MTATTRAAKRTFLRFCGEEEGTDRGKTGLEGTMHRGGKGRRDRRRYMRPRLLYCSGEVKRREESKESLQGRSSPSGEAGRGGGYYGRVWFFFLPFRLGSSLVHCRCVTFFFVMVTATRLHHHHHHHHCRFKGSKRKKGLLCTF